MQKTCEIIKAGTEHIEVIVTLFDAYRRFYQQETDLNSATDFLSERLSNHQSTIFLACLQDEPIGFTQLYPSYSSVGLHKIWILNDLFVKESARGGGVAKKLIHAATQFARDTGARKLSLATARDNIPAQKLYEALGWSKDEVFLHYHFETA